MPSRNIVKLFISNSYYHAYNRGVNKDRIFFDDMDYRVYLNLLKRYLSKEEFTNERGVPYEKLTESVELVAFCLMPNHFHLLLFQKSKSGMTDLLRRVNTSYSRYFNKKYSRVGPIFQSDYKAVSVDNLDYARKITEYIHQNPKAMTSSLTGYEYSSAKFYSNVKAPDWLSKKRLQ